MNWKEYVVIDEDGNASYNADKEAPEKFRSFNAARARAEELAALAPGKKIGIFEFTAFAECPVAKVNTSRRHPVEHYA